MSESTWRRGRFKDKEIWIGVDANGNPRIEAGRVPIRYQEKAGAKVYQAGASRVELDVNSPLQVLAEADAEPPANGKSKATRGSGFGKAGTRTAAQAALAADAARTRIRELEGKAVLCFTDGACKGNPGEAGSGAVVTTPEGVMVERGMALGVATNNVAELTAIDLALTLLDELNIPADSLAAIFTDSSYAHGVLCRGWKAKANQELIYGIREGLALRPGVIVEWIAGHVGVEGNERADALASAAAGGEIISG